MRAYNTTVLESENEAIDAVLSCYDHRMREKWPFIAQRIDPIHSESAILPDGSPPEIVSEIFF